MTKKICPQCYQWFYELTFPKDGFVCFFCRNNILINENLLNNGKINLYLGPMFSGKSSKLVKEYNVINYAFPNKSYCVSYAKDTRYSNKFISTHDGVKIASHPHLNLSELLQDRNIVLNYDYFFIDEGQFFDDLKEICETLVIMGKTIYISALDSDVYMECWENINNIFPICNQIKKYQSICFYCKNKAPFTMREGNNKQKIVIGDSDIYKAVCRKCFMYEKNKS